MDREELERAIADQKQSLKVLEELVDRLQTGNLVEVAFVEIPGCSRKSSGGRSDRGRGDTAAIET